MKSSVSIAFASLLAYCQAFIVPASLSDGVYFQEKDSQGNAVGELIKLAALDTAPERVRDITARQDRLPDPSIHCHGDRSSSDFKSAQAAFDNNCDAAVTYPKGGSIAVKSGNAISYMCNYNNDNRCWRKEFDEASALMDVNCGSSTAGWVTIDTFSKAYGRDIAGVSIC